MSRLKKFARSLFSGYVFLGANVLYTFASVPLALHYLSRPEFGLWALTTQLAGYIGLIDAGMSASVSRILVDYKDTRANGNYGSVIKTGALVGASQGLLILPVGLFLAFTAGPLFHIPEELQGKFMWLVIVQSGLLGFVFATRIFSHLLVAHQRWDVSNYGQALLFGVSLLAMWAGLAAGFGVFSFLLAQTCSTMIALVNLAGCVRLGLFPKRGEWGHATWNRFKELFAFGQDVFLYSIGVQFINASQAILLTRFLGLDVAAVWSVCTRTYTTLGMMLWRVVEYSGPIIAEMMVRGERERLLKRFKELAVFSAGFSIFAAALFGACNGSFVQVWTHGKIQWPPVNDWLLALWLIISTVMRTHVMLAGATKRFAFLRYVFLLEGLVFVGLNVLLHRHTGMTGMLVLSILCTAAFSLPYGLWRTRKYFNLNAAELARWHRPIWRLAWRLIPVAIGMWWAVRGLPPIWQLAMNLGITGVWGAFVLLRYGLDESLQMDIAAKLPLRVRPFFTRLSARRVAAPG
jgi:O-antigen/teichoic acid export membrane protein